MACFPHSRAGQGLRTASGGACNCYYKLLRHFAEFPERRGTCRRSAQVANRTHCRQAFSLNGFVVSSLVGQATRVVESDSAVI